MLYEPTAESTNQGCVRSGKRTDDAGWAFWAEALLAVLSSRRSAVITLEVLLQVYVMVQLRSERKMDGGGNSTSSSSAGCAHRRAARRKRSRRRSTKRLMRRMAREEAVAEESSEADAASEREGK
jgi:hypothetical protein